MDYLGISSQILVHMSCFDEGKKITHVFTKKILVLKPGESLYTLLWGALQLLSAKLYEDFLKIHLLSISVIENQMIGKRGTYDFYLFRYCSTTYSSLIIHEGRICNNDRPEE